MSLRSQYPLSKVVDLDHIEDLTLNSAYHLLKVYEQKDPAKEYEQFILNNYPNSEIAELIRDPEAYKKREEEAAEAQKSI